MGGLARRLRAIEERERRRFGTPEEREQTIGREVLRRMSTPDLEVLARAEEIAPGKYVFTEEIAPVIERYERLREEVSRELLTA